MKYISIIIVLLFVSTSYAFAIKNPKILKCTIALNNNDQRTLLMDSIGNAFLEISTKEVKASCKMKWTGYRDLPSAVSPHYYMQFALDTCEPILSDTHRNLFLAHVHFKASLINEKPDVGTLRIFKSEQPQECTISTFSLKDFRLLSKKEHIEQN